MHTRIWVHFYHETVWVHFALDHHWEYYESHYDQYEELGKSIVFECGEARIRLAMSYVTRAEFRMTRLGLLCPKLSMDIVKFKSPQESRNRIILPSASGCTIHDHFSVCGLYNYRAPHFLHSLSSISGVFSKLQT